METVEDIIREMRAYAKKSEIDGGLIDVWDWLREFADRIDAAYKRDLKAMVDAGDIDMKTAMGEVERLRKEDKDLKDALRCAESLCAFYFVRIAEMSGENSRLKAALKPIIDFHPEIVGNHGEEEAWDSDLMMEAMVEARDIYNGGAK